MADAARQPGPFGCQLLVAAAIVSFLFGLGGAEVAVHGSDIKKSAQNQNSTAPQNQTINVQESSAVVDTVKKVTPAVVSITTTTQTRTFLGFGAEQQAAGTGFIITNDGLIATNKHVAEAGPSNLTVLTNDGKTFTGKVVATDPTVDFALIKIEAKNLPVVSFGNSDNLQVGETVVAVGNALGRFQNTVTTGVISAKERNIEAGDSASGGASESLANLLQTDAAINPGNSGGPLVNLSGQVIGINTAVSGEGSGIGFAIPASQVSRAVGSFQQKGKIIRPSIGIRFIPITKDIQQTSHLPVGNGALLRSDTSGPAIVPGSAAEKAGLKEGDILTGINGQAIDENHSLPGLIGKFNPGDEIEVTLLRDGKEQKVRLKLDQR